MSNQSLVNVDMRVKAFCDFAVPLFSSVVETGGINDHQTENNADVFSRLMGITQNLSLEVAQRLDIPVDKENHGNRWRVTAAISLVVASFYRATAKGLSITADEELIEAGILSVKAICDDYPGISHQNRTEVSLNTVQSMIPVIAAISRFAFGRPETEVLQEVMGRINQRVNEIIEQLDVPEMNELQKQRAHTDLIEALGKLYAESHYAEMDRLLDMPPDERADYVDKQDKKPTMDPVWSAFELRGSMLLFVARNMVLLWT